MATTSVLMSIAAGIILLAPQTSSFGAPRAARAQRRSTPSRGGTPRCRSTSRGSAWSRGDPGRRLPRIQTGVSEKVCATTTTALRLGVMEESAGREPDAIDLDIETQLEAERIMAQLESQSAREGAIEDDGSPKYMPSTDDRDPIVRALKTVLKCKEVTEWEVLDSRWNGNEALRWSTDKGAFFVKMNRVEDLSVFMSEAVSLSALAKANVMQVPKPLHLGKLPRVGEIGPGAFMILEHLTLVPFGPMRPGNQAALGNSLADLHLSKEHEALHQGRFGFPVSNFLALTPLNNAWCDSWTEFFRRRISDQIDGLLKDKAYGRAALSAGRPETEDLLRRLRAIEENVGGVLDGVDVTPSLLHGDLWIGNTGATLEGPCMFDPASFFGHSEFELAIMDMFGGFQEAFWMAYHAKLPKEKGFERRQRLYKLYHYLNQLNLFGDPKVLETVDKLADQILAAN